MTDQTQTPAPGPHATAGTTEPGRPLAAKLLGTGTLPATTAGLGAVEPKLPRWVGD